MAKHCCAGPNCQCETEADAHASCDCPQTLESCANPDCCYMCHEGWKAFVGHGRFT